ncbi:MAG: hypothetical protein AAB074_00005 [Planctomycetota bacterium]
MSRALEKEFGVAPDLDVEAQRAIVTLEKPARFEWNRVANRVNCASYTFGGAHIRARGRLRISADRRTGEFEFAGSGQIMPVSGGLEGIASSGAEVEVVALIENWNETATLVVLAVK